MTVMRRQRWADMSEDARDRLCARGLDDIFDPTLRASIGELIDDVRERGDVAVCDALARHDGIAVEPDRLRITDDEFSQAAVDPAVDAAIDKLLVRYRDQSPQLADLTLVYLAQREDLETIFTLDRRDFSVFRKKGKSGFRLLPES